MDNSLLKLYSELDYLYRNIGAICAGCRDHDCEGYVWLLKEEADALYELGVPVVEINEGIFFIHSFEESEGQIRVDKIRPPCRLRRDGLCTIYKSRPLVCRLYPVGPISLDGDVVLSLHKDCKFSRILQPREKEMFFSQVLGILGGMPPKLLDKILSTYREVDAISAFPEGPNVFEAIKPFRLIGKS